MRNIVWFCTFLGFLIGLSRSDAAELSKEERSFVFGYVATAFMVFKCGDLERDEDTPMVLADKMGVDGSRMWDAARAAMLANLNLPYDRKDLVPEVTRTVHAVAEELAPQVANGSICKKVDDWVEIGWLKRKRK